MPKLRNSSSKGASNPGSIDCESGILPLSGVEGVESTRTLRSGKQVRKSGN